MMMMMTMVVTVAMSNDDDCAYTPMHCTRQFQFPAQHACMLAMYTPWCALYSPL